MVVHTLMVVNVLWLGARNVCEQKLYAHILYKEMPLKRTSLVAFLMHFLESYRVVHLITVDDCWAKRDRAYSSGLFLRAFSYRKLIMKHY